MLYRGFKEKHGTFSSLIKVTGLSFFEAETGVNFQALDSNLSKIGGLGVQHAIKLIKRRSSWIHGLMDHRKQGCGGWTGFWSDNQGGWMSLDLFSKRVS